MRERAVQKNSDQEQQVTLPGSESLHSAVEHHYPHSSLLTLTNLTRAIDESGEIETFKKAVGGKTAAASEFAEELRKKLLRSFALREVREKNEAFAEKIAAHIQTSESFQLVLQALASENSQQAYFRGKSSGARAPEPKEDDLFIEDTGALHQRLVEFRGYLRAATATACPSLLDKRGNGMIQGIGGKRLQRSMRLRFLVQGMEEAGFSPDESETMVAVSRALYKMRKGESERNAQSYVQNVTKSLEEGKAASAAAMFGRMFGGDGGVAVSLMGEVGVLEAASAELSESTAALAPEDKEAAAVAVAVFSGNDVKSVPQYSGGVLPGSEARKEAALAWKEKDIDGLYATAYQIELCSPRFARLSNGVLPMPKGVRLSVESSMALTAIFGFLDNKTAEIHLHNGQSRKEPKVTSEELRLKVESELNSLEDALQEQLQTATDERAPEHYRGIARVLKKLDERDAVLDDLFVKAISRSPEEVRSELLPQVNVEFRELETGNLKVIEKVFIEDDDRAWVRLRTEYTREDDGKPGLTRHNALGSVALEKITDGRWVEEKAQ